MQYEPNGGGIQSAISLLPDLDTQDNDNDKEEENNDNNVLSNHFVISKSLQDIDAELDALKGLVSKELLPLLNEEPTVVDLPTPPPNSSSSSNSIRLQFPFKRGSSSPNLEKQQNKPAKVTTTVTHSIFSYYD
jgi:hypothetical protein